MEELVISLMPSLANDYMLRVYCSIMITLFMVSAIISILWRIFFGK